MSEPHNHTLKSSFKLDRSFFRKISLLPFFAFIGLGADSVSSSCYGPEEAFLGLLEYPHLSIFVTLLAILTIWVISTSYCQIIDLFPHGGGGYVVASKLLSPTCGLISGCALLVDYVLTITISVASGMDAIFSLLPLEYQTWKLFFKILTVTLITGINLRGVKESIWPWIPIFLLFGFTHVIAFLWAFTNHFFEFAFISHGVFIDLNRAESTLGVFGTLFIILHSYSVGAGTYTGIEAVSNGMNLLRDPKAHNARKTMLYMSIALAITVTGLVVSYLLYHVTPQPGMTLNGVLMHKIGEEMDAGIGPIFCSLALFAEAALLMMAAQSGFLGGPRILANMAGDRWLPSKFSNLSDRFVMHHGILLIGAAAFLLMLYAHGNVTILVVLYSLSVFITFTLSQLGMVMHWAQERVFGRPWLKGLLINSTGFFLTLFILISLVVVKFEEGAWLTLCIIGALILISLSIKKYYDKIGHMLTHLSGNIPAKPPRAVSEVHLDSSLHTVVLFVSGLKNLALHSVEEAIKILGDNIDHFVFLQVGLIDAGNFKGQEEIQRLQEHTFMEAEKLVKLVRKQGYSAECLVSTGLDIGDEIARLAQEVYERHPSCIFVGGQLVLPHETMFSHWLHNQTLYIIQRRIHELTYPFITIPIYIQERLEAQKESF